MTEAQYESCHDLHKLFDPPDYPPSERKVRLFAVACCQMLGSVKHDTQIQMWIGTAERYADGAASEHERRAAIECMMANAHGEPVPSGGFSGVILSPLQQAVAHALRRDDEWLVDLTGRAVAMPGVATADTIFRLTTACRLADQHWIATDRSGSTGFGRVWRSVRRAVMEARATFTGRGDPAEERGLMEAERHRARLAKDILGPPPFQPKSCNPNWLTSTVHAIARQMYETRDFSPMPILADALQDAGCEDEAVLSHCRGDSPHVRGCWVVELVLGKG